MRDMAKVVFAAGILLLYTVLIPIPAHARPGEDPMMDTFALALVPFVLIPVLAISAIVRENKSLLVPLAAVAILTAWLFVPLTAYMLSYIAYLVNRAAS